MHQESVRPLFQNQGLHRTQKAISVRCHFNKNFETLSSQKTPYQAAALNHVYKNSHHN